EQLGRALELTALEEVSALLVARGPEVGETEVRAFRGGRAEPAAGEEGRPAQREAAPEPEPGCEREDRRRVPSEVAVARAFVVSLRRLDPGLDALLDARD